MPQTAADYVRIYRKLTAEMREEWGSEREVKIALLSSFTIQPLSEILTVKCLIDGIKPDIYTAPYNQYTQEILDRNSSLYAFKPDIIVLFIDLRTLLGDYYFLPYQLNNTARKTLIFEKLDQLTNLVGILNQNCSAKVMVHNFEMPSFSPLGILESKQEFGIVEAVQLLNQHLRKVWKDNDQVLLFDYQNWCSYYGQHSLCDPKYYYLGDVKLSFEYMPMLCDAYLGYLKPLLGILVKCIVLDLDNTLWGGVLGEDGLEGIRLGPTAEGRPYWEFQKFFLALYQRGIILALNSKNNAAEVKQVLAQHPYMLLREEHFAAERINWLDKAENLRSLAQELNIGLDSMVFIDDDPLNREIVKGSLPEVTVVDLPEDPALYLTTVQQLNIWNVLQFTAEDQQKGQMYTAQRQRKEMLESSASVEDYLSGLGMTAKIHPANTFTIPRIAQMTLKTNQFNLTTRRYEEGQIRAMAASNRYLIAGVQVIDKFGDNGITGLVMVEKGDQRWRIDNFLLSCRVIGRKIEDVMLAYVWEQARQAGVSIIEGEFIPTAKNIPSQDFYVSHGFRHVRTEAQRQIWEFDMRHDFPYPDFIQVIMG
ncbi:NLI interacting factor-like phosphatase [Desulfosporosinus acididurans]|uniref:NLI interacting factor-like phosphatase n=1 Tax=Desulfosporosinus acididurans TaxID=476652 RepID=A0A0J1IK41_9FIRM|nr:NLI interacting factor-like phosphatase [Desulfosporosinus acididurans]